MGTLLLKFVSVYLLFDSLIFIYTGVLKGAGDSRFVMWSMILTGIVFLFIPLWSGIKLMGMGLYFHGHVLQSISWCSLYLFSCATTAANGKE